MKKIDYIDRACFEEFISEDSSFIRTLINDFEIDSVLEIPCANGRNLSVIGDAVSSAFFADISPAMVESVKQKIVKEKKTNCTALELDMCDVSLFPFTVDAILIMQQAFQMLTIESAREALGNLCRTQCHYIVIDIYDFLCGSTDFPKFLVTDNFFVDNENRNWVRHSSLSKCGDHQINLIHNYRSNNEAYCANVNLYNYSRKEFIALCDECGHTILNYYTDYSFGNNLASGRTIFIIDNGKRFGL